MADITVVGKEKLVCPALSRKLRRGNVAVNFGQRGLLVYFDKLLIDGFSLQLNNPFSQVCRRKLQGLHIIFYERELCVGVYQRDALYFGENITAFGFVRFQEFTARRHVEENILHGDSRSHSTGYGLLTFHFGAGNFQQCSHFVFGAAGFKFHVGDGRHGSQRFAAKTAGVQCEKIIGCFNLGCGVALKCHSGIGGAHSLAVVDYLNECSSRIFYNDADMFGSGVERILHQLFHYRCRPLNDLAGGNLIGNGIG